MYTEFYEKVDGLAKAIGVTTSTAKKYYLLFEEQGYNFKRNQQGQLLFSQDDIDLFKELIVLKNEKGMTVSKAVKELIQDRVITLITPENKDITVITKQVTTVMTELNELKKLVQDQHQIIQKQQKDFEEQLQKQQDYITNSLNHRDEILTTTLRKMQESQQEIATSISNEKGKQKWWKRLIP